MSDHREPETLTGEPVLEPPRGDAEPARSVRESPDPRDRPSDPAGTQPKHNPDELLPARGEPVALLGSSFRPTPSGPPAAPPSAAATVAASDGGSGELAAPLPQSAHAPRFQFLLGALGAIAAAGMAIAVAIAASPKPGPAAAWSSWHPTGGDIDPAQQIADHVAPEYRLDNGHQIVQVQGGPLTLGGQPAELALLTSGAQPSLLPGNGVIYELRGSGANGSIGEGTPSAQRLLLLRREALELALYTFRYVSGVSQVVVTVPPAPPASTTGSSSSTGAGTTSARSKKSASSATAAPAAAASAAAASTASPVNHALLFRPGDIAPELDRPLGLTLSRRTPTVSTVARSVDSGLVSQLTTHNLYDFSIVTDSQSNPVLLLQPPGLGG